MEPKMWVSIFIVGIVSLCVPFALRHLLTKRGVIDLPNERSSHNRPTLRGGGVATLLGLISGGVWLITTSISEVDEQIFVVLIIAILVGLVGLVEDIRGLKISVRASLQLLGGLVIGFYLWQQLSASFILIPLVALVFAFHVNLTNFMDGVNGMSALHGLVVGAIFSFAGIMYSESWLILAGLMISIAFLTFLPWNLLPPGMFLGDVGSYLLGASIGATALIAWADGVNVLIILAAVSIYWADTGFTLMRRLLTRAPVFKAHRSHIYQRLTDTGLSHLAVAGIVASLTLINALVSFLILSIEVPWLLSGLFILFIVIFYLFLPNMRGSKWSSKWSR